MRLNEYQLLASRTISEDFHIACGRGESSDYDLIHASLGLSSEIAEIAFDEGNKANVIQEIGDCMWYTALGCSAFKFDMENLDLDYENTEPIMDLVVQSGIIADRIKRALFYGVDLDKETIIKCLGCIVKSLDSLSIIYGTNLESVMEKNITKLRTRYPDKFSKECAVCRNVWKEEKHFEEEA